MSLTGHLRDSASPVREWFALRLPATSSLVREANQELRRRPATSSDAPSRSGVASAPALPSTAVKPQLVGTALDLLVRATLAPVRASAVPMIGALRLAENGITDAPKVAAQAGARLSRLEPSGLAADAALLHEVASLCVLLARFEQSGRSRQAAETMVYRLAATEPTVESYTAALVDARDRHDIAERGSIRETDRAVRVVGRRFFEDLAVALADAVDAAVTDAAALEPFCVEVRERRGGPLLPPVIHIAGRRFRDRMREASGDDMQAIMVIGDPAPAGDVVSDGLVDRLDDRALEACRALSTAARPPAATADVDELVRGLGDRLAGLLHARTWPQNTDPFLALVRLCYRGGEGLALAIRRAVDGAGREHVERFLRSVSSMAVRRSPEQLAAQVTVARKDRAVLAEVPREHGLGAHADRLAFHDVKVGLQVLTAADDAPVRSRLGGPPLLPAGCAWPHHGPGRPLSFLAGLNPRRSAPPAAISGCQLTDGCCSSLTWTPAIVRAWSITPTTAPVRPRACCTSPPASAGRDGEPG